MKIGIIVYSQTGNTLSVAEKLKVALKKAGNEVIIDEIKVVRENKDIKFTSIPDISKYECIVFATFTEGFALCPVMNLYLNQLNDLTNKKIAGLVTEYFPYPWMGGNNSIKQMDKVCLSKGKKLAKTGIINWSNKKREEIIGNLVNNFITYFEKE